MEFILSNYKTFTSSAEVFEWLSGFINFERGQKLKSFRVDRMEFLAKLAGNPERCAPSIHIAGSKGKGSVTVMLSAILTAAGFRTARYMSPHVTDIRERICLDDSYFSEEIYCAAGSELRELIEQKLTAEKNELFNPAAEEGYEPTFWELLTLLFFLCAPRGQCDIMVIETGMGGRLDSTNIVDPLASVITLIELEHTVFLGNTIAAIAGEKAGIIKQDKPLILAKQSKEALEVFKKTTQEKNSRLIYLPETAELSNVKISRQGTDFTLDMKKPAFSAQFSITIPGKVQAENAALAIVAIKTAFPQISEEIIRKGLAALSIPARFEKIDFKAELAHATELQAEQPPFIIDGAHTPESLAQCIETFCALYGEGGILIFGCAADKDAAAMARIAHTQFSKIFITTPGTFKISNPALVYNAFASITGREKTELVTDTQEAIKKAITLAKEEKNLPILGTGSFYLVSEIRKFVVL